MQRILLLILFGVLVAVSMTVPNDTALAREFPVIDAKKLKSKMDSGQKLMLINPLSKIEFNEKHIPGSINIPLQEMLITNKLPLDKDHLIVTYCLGPK